MRQLTSNPPADFTAVNQAAFTNLSVRQASITAGTVKTNGPAASAPITERLTLAGLGTITLSSQLHLVQHDGKWLVQWSPATIAPQLRTGDQLSLRTTWPARAAILGAAGAPLTTSGPGGDHRRGGGARQERRRADVRAGCGRRDQAGGQQRDRRREGPPDVFRAGLHRVPGALRPAPADHLPDSGHGVPVGHSTERHHPWPDRGAGGHGRAGDRRGTQPARRAVQRAERSRSDRSGAGRGAPAGRHS